MRAPSPRLLVRLLGLLVVATGCPKDDPQESASTSASASASSTSTTTTGDASTSSSGLSGSSTSAASTSGATESTSTTAAQSTGCHFLECYDQGDVPEMCDLWTQNCPEGHKCMPYANDGGNSWNATKCSPIDRDPDAVGEPCAVEESGVSGVDSCDAGSMCWDVDPETDEGTCIAFCGGTVDNPTCAPGSQCSINGDGTLILRIPTCDPLMQDCDDGDMCLPYSESAMCIPDASGDTGAFGDPCEYANACDPGLVCLNPEYLDGCQASGCCSPICDTSAPNTCPGDGQECLPWWEEGQAPEGLENVGVCGVPQ